ATFYSLPISLKVTPAPITLANVPSTSQIFPGTMIGVPVKISRRYGFNEAVDLTLSVPDDVKGLASQKITISKDQAEGKVILEAAPDANAGEHKLTLQASLKLNGQELKVEQSITVKVV